MQAPTGASKSAITDKTGEGFFFIGWVVRTAQCRTIWMFGRYGSSSRKMAPVTSRAQNLNYKPYKNFGIDAERYLVSAKNVDFGIFHCFPPLSTTQYYQVVQVPGGVSHYGTRYSS
jgi:hypothetical protein